MSLYVTLMAVYENAEKTWNQPPKKENTWNIFMRHIQHHLNDRNLAPKQLFNYL